MLKIPAIDLIGGKCVRLYQGDYDRSVTFAPDPVEQALRFQSVGFRRIHVVDLEGARSGSGANREAIRRIISASRVPVQVGGGIRGVDDVVELFDAGAGFLILGTVAVEDPRLVDQWVERWGGERFLLSLDLRRGRVQVQGWTEESPLTPDEFLERAAAWQMRELISTDVEKDGTLESPNYASYRALVEKAGERIKVIAAGGVSRPEHIERLARDGVSGVVIGRALYEGKVPWEEFIRVG